MSYELGSLEQQVNMERIIRVIAGTFILVSLALATLVSPWWYLFTAFVGMNLIQSGFTRWCLMEDILRAVGVGREPRAAAGTRNP